MSTSGKYGERQSWRRAETSAAGKRRTIKSLLTIIAVVLTILFIYMLLPGPNRRLITILVSNEYDTDVITPPMFGANARAVIKSQLQVDDDRDLRGSSQRIRSGFQETEKVSEYLDDPDDTVMVIVRGYLMQDREKRPALACSDLAIGATPEAPEGLLPLTDILEPLATSMPKSFEGLRLVVLDVEPLAAHPSLGQWNDEVFAALDQTVKQLPGPMANRLWVLVTRGPLQSVGWDHTTEMPLSTQTLLDGLNGAADLGGDDRDYKIELRELCAFMAHRYDRMPRSEEVDTPRIMLLRGGTGIVESSSFARGDLDVWVSRAIPEPDEEETDEEPQSVSEDLADKISMVKRHDIETTPVLMQAAQPAPADGTAAVPASPPPGAGAAAPAPADAQPAPGTPAGAPDPSSAAPPAGGPAVPAAAATGKAAESTFWDIRDQFESIPLSNSDGKQNVSIVSLAPQLWRRLIVKVLGGQVKDFDPASPTETPRQVAQDLIELQRLIKGQNTTSEIEDSVVLKLIGLLNEHLASRREPPDRRVRSADALQHAVAVAQSRIWSWLEFQRQAIICGAQIPDQSLQLSTLEAERLLDSGTGSDTPDQGMLDRQLSQLHRDIELFDRSVDDAVKQLLAGFALDDPSRTWELTRAGWAWLRSPLPSGPQRTAILAAIRAARLDPTDVEDLDVDTEKIVFAGPAASPKTRQLVVSGYRPKLDGFEAPIDFSGSRGDMPSWRQILEQDSSQSVNFTDRFAAALRIDPRINIERLDPPPIIHSMTAVPVPRNPNVTLLNDDGQALGESAILRLDTMQDVRRVSLRINPDRDRPTRLLVSYEVRSASSIGGNARVDVVWKVPGVTVSKPGDPIAITIDAESYRDLPLEIRPAGLAESDDDLVLQLQVRGDRQSDEIEGVVGIHKLPIELPRENRLRLVASSVAGVGCSKEVLSDDGGLPGGLWLRTFNDRKTPFRLSLFNESGKACYAQVWLVKLPNPMPEVAAYWPDFAANKYSNPAEGVLDASGRIQRRFLREDRILKGPSKIAIAADQKRTALNFSPPPPADGAAAMAPPSDSSGGTAIDVSHGMALVCRLVDENDVVMPEKDQVIYLVAKPWAPSSYMSAEVIYANNEVEVNAELKRLIDGDSIPDEIPEIEKRPVTVRWVQDDQWASFKPETSEPPADFGVNLNPQAGKAKDYFRVPVVGRRRESWVRLDIDGWPRAVQHFVQHQPGAVGQARVKNEINFGSIALTRPPVGNQPQPTTIYYSPEEDVYFKGNGENLVATLKADFTAGVWNQTDNPEVTLHVEGRPYASYRTDRLISTAATEIGDDGVVTLLTQVTDLQATLSQGQRSDDRIPISAELEVGGVEQDTASINAILDSTAPETITIRPQDYGPYIAPRTLGFSISASDSRRDASGIAMIRYGLETQTEKARNTLSFDPPLSIAAVPASRTEIKFPVPGDFVVVVDAFDAAGNVTTNSYQLSVERPKPAPGPAAGNDGGEKPKPALMGRLHGVINTRAGMSGTLTLSPAPKPVTSKEKTILGQDRRFDFGPLPEGKYTLKFKGNIQNISKTLAWKELDIDTTPNKSKPLSLSLDDAEAE